MHVPTASLPPDLRWIEVDLPGLIHFKNEALANEQPVCSVERVALDIAVPNGRERVLARVAATDVARSS